MAYNRNYITEKFNEFQSCFENKLELDEVSSIKKDMEQQIPKDILFELNRVSFKIYKTGKFSFQVDIGCGKIGSFHYMELHSVKEELDDLIWEGYSLEQAHAILHKKYTNHNIRKGMKTHKWIRILSEMKEDIDHDELDVEDILSEVLS